jgi:hypothetical protein
MYQLLNANYLNIEATFEIISPFLSLLKYPRSSVITLLKTADEV